MAAIVVSFSGKSAAAVARMVKFVMICGIAATLCACAWLDLKQRELGYRATPGRPADFVGLREGDVMYELPVPATAPQQHLQLWWLPNVQAQAPTLLYLHGTFRNLYQNLRKVEALRQAGFSVLAVEYRGWGSSSALVPSEASIEADAALAWGELIRRQGDPSRRVIYGHSMGSGVAVDLASRLHAGADYGGLILESSFTSVRDVVSAAGLWGPVASWFVTQQFDSIDKIGRIDAPVLIMHGQADTTVPVELGHRLYEAAPPGAVWVSFPGGSHSGLDEENPQAYRAAVHSLIDRLPHAP